jgi:hypothetical protein
MNWLDQIGADALRAGDYRGVMTAVGNQSPLPPPVGGSLVPPGPGPSGFPAPPPPAQQPPRRSSRGGKALATTGIALAIILAAAALAVALTGRSDNLATPTLPTTETPVSSSQPTSTEQADRALCTAIAPLMKESNAAANAFIGLGDTGTPARDAAIPQFRTTTESWARRAQAVLDDHSATSPFFHRTLQRYIDDMSLFVVNVRPGPATKYDEAAWSDSLVAYGGPLSVCQRLGVNW